LKKELEIKNELDLPAMEKVIVSIGLSESRFDKEAVENRINTLTKICGQKPHPLKAKKAISNFKLREGQIIAYAVTLRGIRMYDFIEKLFNIVLPRIRDFRGINEYSFDQSGNLNFGIKEQVAFPEIKMEEMKNLHGLGITITTTAKDKKEGIALIKSLGAIISKEKRQREKEELESIQEMREEREKKAKKSAEKSSHETVKDNQSTEEEEK